MTEPVKVPFPPKLAAEIVRLTHARLNLAKGHLLGLDIDGDVTVNLDAEPPFYIEAEAKDA